MNNRYYIVKLKSSEHGYKWMYGFADSFCRDDNNKSNLFLLDEIPLLVENPADAISICMLINSKLT